MRKDVCDTFFIKERHNQGVILVHPGMHHSYQIALGLQEASLLQKFITRFYYKDQGGFAKLLRLFPPKYATTLQREFKRRKLDGLTTFTGDVRDSNFPVGSDRLLRNRAGRPRFDRKQDPKTGLGTRYDRISDSTCGIAGLLEDHGLVLAEQPDRSPLVSLSIMEGVAAAVS